MHLFQDCLYLLERLHPAEWSPDPEIDEKVKNKLKRISPRTRKTIGRPQEDTAHANVQKSGGLATETTSEEETASTTAVSTTPKALGSFAAESSTKYINYKFRNPWILDSGTDMHVCNNPTRFKHQKAATDDDTLISNISVQQPARLLNGLMIMRQRLHDHL